MSIFQCSICSKRPTFNTSQARRQHSHDSPNHSPWSYCIPCSRKFIHENALESHLNACHISERNRYEIDSSGQIYRLVTATLFHCCEYCNRKFSSESSLNQHLRDKVHAERPKTPVDLCCKQCKRTFYSEHALEQHKSSVKHIPLVDKLRCITGSGCKKVTTSPSAMLHHLEGGSCKSKIDRRKLDRLIKEKDTERIITSDAVNSMRMDDFSSDDGSRSSESESGYRSGTSSPGGVNTSTPPSSRGGSVRGSADAISSEKELPAPVEGEWTCRKCPMGGTRKFDTQHALQQHMSSAAHASMSYHCPVMLVESGKVESRKGVTRPFTAFSGATQHLESGACKGGKETLENSMLFVDQILREAGFDGFELISSRAVL